MRPTVSAAPRGRHPAAEHRYAAHHHRPAAHHHRPAGVRSVQVFSVPALAREVSTARHRTARVLRDWGLHDDGLDTACLVISELVGNAARHAYAVSPTATVTLTRTATSLVLAVRDDHPVLPRPGQSVEEDEESGRGLMIVDHLTSASGGTLQVRSVAPRGKEVRATFPVADARDSAHAAACRAGACQALHFDGSQTGSGSNSGSGSGPHSGSNSGSDSVSGSGPNSGSAAGVR